MPPTSPFSQALEGDQVTISAAPAATAEALPIVSEVSFQSDNPLFMEFAAVMVSCVARTAEDRTYNIGTIFTAAACLGRRARRSCCLSCWSGTISCMMGSRFRRKLATSGKTWIVQGQSLLRWLQWMTSKLPPGSR